VSDRPDLEAQIGRPLRADSEVVARCHLGLPVVAEVPPILDDGTPFPTRFWLTCPLATIRIGRLEAAGGVRSMERHAEANPDFATSLDMAHARYEKDRDALVPADSFPVPSGGVAGARAGVKCLHAHYADHAAGNDNPVGHLVAPWVEPLNCDTPCVVDGTTNPLWREPR
jgi:uncharacterized protein